MREKSQGRLLAESFAKGLGLGVFGVGLISSFMNTQFYAHLNKDAMFSSHHNNTIAFEEVTRLVEAQFVYTWAMLGSGATLGTGMFWWMANKCAGCSDATSDATEEGRSILENR